MVDVIDPKAIFHISSGFGTTPVSYTHLDVYKRQHWEHRYCYESLYKVVVGYVSMDNIDVYKRQVWYQSRS